MALDQAFIDEVRSRLAVTTVEHYIDGKWRAGERGELFETCDPSTNEPLTNVCRGHAEDIYAAA